MKKHEIEIERAMLKNEEEVIKKLRKSYIQALRDTNKKLEKINRDIERLIELEPENETLIRSKIYQQSYQKELKKEIASNLNRLKNGNLKTVEEYLKQMYEEGYTATIYSMQKEGIPITVPINQDLLIKAVTFKTEDIPLSTRIYDNVEDAKKRILSEISRGINTGMNYSEIARNIENSVGVSMRKANQIAQNEGQRVRLSATKDMAHRAKEMGADLVKQWDATLDGRTRPHHRELDQQIAELDEPFKYSGGEVQAPKEFGIATEDINCRCALLIKPRWDVEETAIMMK